MNLPEEYKIKMTDLLGEEGFRAYEKSLDAPRMFGLRANTLKIQAEEFENIFGGIISITERVPWENDGYYYDPLKSDAAQPGKLPFYHAGLYYIQEPSAMYPAAQLGVRPGDKVLDLCAAPGGKSTKIACELKGEGLLVSNDISEERVKALIYNIELSGAQNVIVTNESPERLAGKLTGYFDKILVDAPCSGEGMFRKDDEAVRSWGVYKNGLCASMQREILEYAHILLKSGGRIMYSTCTFDPCEDEEMIRSFMERHTEYSLVPLAKTSGVEDGLFGMNEAARLWPHKLKGEGHFAALLVKSPFTCESAAQPGPAAQAEDMSYDRSKKQRSAFKTKSYTVLEGAPCEFEDFWNENMTGDIPRGVYYTAADVLYFLPCMPPNVDGLKVPKLGLRLGDMPTGAQALQIQQSKNRARGSEGSKKRPRAGKFRPSQQFCMAFGNSFRRKIRLPYNGEDIKRYLRGETLTGTQCEGDGVCAVCVEDYAVGMGITERGVLKNLYPKGWRRMI